MTNQVLHQPFSPSMLLDQHGRRIDLIGQCANEAQPAEFERKWLSVLTRCAGWFGSMPLNPDLYREPGGAFRFTIETAFYAMRLAGGQKFGTNLSSEKRRRIEPQYNYAVFLAAVCSGLDEPHRHFVVTRERDMAEWNPSAHGAAATWLGAEPYRLRRRDAALPVERMRTGMLAQMLIGPDLLGGLDAEVLAELFGAINPSAQPLDAESLLQKVVRQAIGTATDFDRKAQRAVFEPVQFTVPSAVDVAALLQPVVTAAGGAGAAPATPSTQSAADAGAVTAPAAQSPVNPGGATTSVTGALEAGAGSPANEPGRTPKSLMDLLDIEPDTSEGIRTAEPAPTSSGASSSSNKADQMGLPFGVEENRGAAAVNPADIPTTRVQSRPAAVTGDQGLDDVLNGAPNIIRELFRALREDVAAGKAKVSWSDKGLVLPKRLIGSYGVTSETLVEHLRKRSLLQANANGEITLAPRAGELILERSGS